MEEHSTVVTTLREAFSSSACEVLGEPIDDFVLECNQVELRNMCNLSDSVAQAAATDDARIPVLDRVGSPLHFSNCRDNVVRNFTRTVAQWWQCKLLQLGLIQMSADGRFVKGGKQRLNMLVACTLGSAHEPGTDPLTAEEVQAYRGSSLELAERGRVLRAARRPLLAQRVHELTPSQIEQLQPLIDERRADVPPLARDEPLRTWQPGRPGRYIDREDTLEQHWEGLILPMARMTADIAAYSAVAGEGQWRPSVRRARKAVPRLKLRVKFAELHTDALLLLLRGLTGAQLARLRRDAGDSGALSGQDLERVACVPGAQDSTLSLEDRLRWWRLVLRRGMVEELESERWRFEGAARTNGLKLHFLRSAKSEHTGDGAREALSSPDVPATATAPAEGEDIAAWTVRALRQPQQRTNVACLPEQACRGWQGL